AHTLTRAWILLKLADGWDEAKVAETFAVTQATVKNIAHRFTEGGLELVLHDKVQQRRRQALTGQQAAQLIAITCSPAPDAWKARRRCVDTSVRWKPSATTSAEALPGNSPRLMRASSWSGSILSKRLRRTDGLKEKGKAERFACFQEAVMFLLHHL